MFRLLIILSFLFIGCKEEIKVPPVKQPYISPELYPYLNEFIFDMFTQGLDISKIFTLDSIKIVPLNERICFSEDAIGCFDGKTVKIKEFNYNDELDTPENRDTYLRVILYHEMGHALFNLFHEGRPNELTIMHPKQQVRIEYYKKYWPELHARYIGYIKWSIEHNIHFMETSSSILLKD